jgi:hypothetical protein
MKKSALPIIICVLTLAVFISPPLLSHATGGFGNVSAILNNTLLGYPSELSVTFTLPSDSRPITTTDYIQVYMPDFTDVTAPFIISGDLSGIPIYSVNGQYAQITNVFIPPGGTVYIGGITAVNPLWEDFFQIILMVSEDQAATLLKNYINVIATVNQGQVSVTASIDAELGRLLISGYTAPNTFIIFTEAEAVIGTDVADSTGFFSHLFSGLQPVTHIISFYGVDTQNRTTSPITLQIYTPAYQQTNVTNQLLSPTIELASNRVLQTDPLIASGSALPSAALTFFTDSPMRSYATTSASTGDWSLNITDTQTYVLGDYRAFSLAQNLFGLQSLTSPAIGFTIASTIGGGTSCGDISQGDLNCDNSVDLTDFSILMYHWSTANSEADINADGTVNLTDFSIMMYWWGT